ncbi:involved in lipopolysaccharide biosynthesis [Polaribacter irgensii 23-P]|uniref:Involved in lipopolysaccharide biosynthesis n=1 Tax=Polaribacter irgensii 23-P TaxID=313594 RepID=A4BYL8_9FLAO|nr:WlaTC/HtrL family glycosyltransferase [Polaribacter irgensii]EAR12261.1 involved in lipopolysaccharide biosynthesis [Polaribacter irgensii 23-P]
MEKTTLITAFFDIGRRDFKEIPRSNDKYHDYFKFWARLKNNLIIYTDETNYKLIKSIRSEFGLEEKTTIIIIDNIFDIKPNIYKRLIEIENDKYFKNFREKDNATSNSGRYNYLMLLKSWFIQDAVSRNLTETNTAWIDYGFNHGGKVFNNPNDFDFEWSPTNVKKINMYYLDKIDQRPIFEIVKRLEDCIMGPLILMPSEMTERFYNMNLESMQILNSIGLMDDDQLIMLFSYRRNPTYFNIIKSNWFLGLSHFNGGHLSIKKEKKQNVTKIFAIKLYGSLMKKYKLICYLSKNYSSH